MKTKFKYTCMTLLVILHITACNKALDINNNPNSPTTSTPELILPQAMVATARLIPTYSTYGGRLVGYYATSGGVSGWGDMITYDFNTGNFAALWNNTYDVLTDLAYVIEKTDNEGPNAAFYYAAELFRAYNFLNLIDTYNDIPYTEAVQGSKFLTPKYDKAEVIYVDLAKRLDLVIAYFKKAGSLGSKFTSADILFSGNAGNWAKFANSLKLRMTLRAGDKASFENKMIDDIGVLDIDAIINPGFTRIDDKQNPTWNNWAYLASGNAVGVRGTQFIPTLYLLSFYDGFKLSDEQRADLSFANGISVNKNQLGNTTNAPTGIAPSAWVLRPITGAISATNYRDKGLVKGPSAGQPIMLAAEAQFLAAEGAMQGLLSGEAKEYFEEGIKASFNYLNKNESDVNTLSKNELSTYLSSYKANNTGSFLVNFDKALTNSEKLEAIITQKYIALNFLFGHEAWNEWRRTNFPLIIGTNVAANARTTFVSIASSATSVDKLPTRILYPNTEFSYNSLNVPTIDKYSSKIFWAK